MVAPPAQPVGNEPAPGDAATLATVPSRSGGLIEVVLPDGVIVRVDVLVDAPALLRGSGRAGWAVIAIASGLRV